MDEQINEGFWKHVDEIVIHEMIQIFDFDFLIFFYFLFFYTADLYAFSIVAWMYADVIWKSMGPFGCFALF